MPNKIPIHKNQSDDYFLTWDDEKSKQTALRKAGSALDNVQVIQRADASSVWKNILPNTSVRDQYSKTDYDLFRPDEATQKEYYDKFRQCNVSYKRMGIVRNVIDLMSDFACQGIEICSTSKSTEKILKEWAKKVSFDDRSERFLNLLYRMCNVVVVRSIAKLKAKD